MWSQWVVQISPITIPDRSKTIRNISHHAIRGAKIPKAPNEQLEQEVFWALDPPGALLGTIGDPQGSLTAPQGGRALYGLGRPRPMGMGRAAPVMKTKEIRRPGGV